MKTIYSALLVIALSLGLTACDPNGAPTGRDSQAAAARDAANSIQFNGNAEIDNIKWRLELTSKPGVVGYIMLLNESGSPILYETVVGKITSGSKRLTAPSRWWRHSQDRDVIGPAPSDEGTWGSSNEYVFYRTAAGEYRQWNGKYLYSDKPFRLRVEPLIVQQVTDTK
jgi:hypothetical protein